ASQTLAGIDPGGGDLYVRIDGDATVFLDRLRALGVDATPAGEERGRDEIVVRRNGHDPFDAVRDAAADLGVPLRQLRAQTRSLEDLYFGNVGGGDGDRP
ncbi:MAG TPA: hypothetical protein VER37_11270, partial [Thermomicrobiales bacterium]|nr:hypothetical protein [Thermomicrobiales bacterium]